MEDIVVGNVLSKNAAYQARAAALAAGFSEKTPTEIVNRFCSSGLMAITSVSNKIRAGQIEIGLAVGSESMSQEYVGNTSDDKNHLTSITVEIEELNHLVKRLRPTRRRKIAKWFVSLRLYLAKFYPEETSPWVGRART